MYTYEIWLKKENDGRAPEYAFLDADFAWVGEVKARSLRDLVMKMSMVPTADGEDPEELDLMEQRSLRVGDVVWENRAQHYVLTPQDVWARVQAFTGGDEESPDAEA